MYYYYYYIQHQLDRIEIIFHYNEKILFNVIISINFNDSIEINEIDEYFKLLFTKLNLSSTYFPKFPNDTSFYIDLLIHSNENNLEYDKSKWTIDLYNNFKDVKIIPIKSIKNDDINIQLYFTI